MATLLREHRGDGHIAALMAAGLDPCEALVSFAAIGAAPPEVFANRGAARLAELAGPLLGAAFESGLLPSQSTLGITAVAPPAPRE